MYPYASQEAKDASGRVEAEGEDRVTMGIQDERVSEGEREREDIECLRIRPSVNGGGRGTCLEYLSEYKQYLS